MGGGASGTDGRRGRVQNGSSVCVSASPRALVADGAPLHAACDVVPEVVLPYHLQHGAAPRLLDESLRGQHAVVL